MANDLIKTITRIDPTEGFIEYVKTVKPYHTKILDVIIDYLYTDAIAASITEKWSWVIELRRPQIDAVYECGYGLIWDPFLDPATPDSLLTPVSIVQAINGAYPSPNVNDYLNYTFLVGPVPTPVNFSVAAVGPTSNQMVFSENWTVSGIDFINNRWQVTDASNLLVAKLTAGDTPKKFVISSNTGTGNGQYTISGTPTNAAGITYVTVVEPLPIQATGTGLFHRVLEQGEAPDWLAGTKIQFATTSGTLPQPLNSVNEYYFSPTKTVGYFNVAIKRHPQRYEDYVDLRSTGSGALTLHRTEFFQPGMGINITGSALNNGRYFVRDVLKSGANEYVFVYQPVITPTGAVGSATFVPPGYDEPPFCLPTQMSDIHTDVFIHESITFVYVSLTQSAAITETVSTGGSTDATIVHAPFATWNPADKSAGITLSNGNKTADTNNSNFETVRSTKVLNTTNGGKFYFEFTPDVIGVNADWKIAFKESAVAITSGIRVDSGNYTTMNATGQTISDEVMFHSPLTGPTLTITDLGMVAIDMTTGKVWLGKNGVWSNVADPVAGTFPTILLPTATNVCFAFATHNTLADEQITVNFGATPFTYAPPAGFSAGLY